MTTPEELEQLRLQKASEDEFILAQQNSESVGRA